MKRVLWISRHAMTAPQKADLDRALGEEAELIPYTQTVEDIRELAPALARADVVAAVLPARLLAQLMRVSGGRPVLQSVCGRTATGRLRTLPDGTKEPEFVFSHRSWQRIVRLEMEEEEI